MPLDRPDDEQQQGDQRDEQRHRRGWDVRDADVHATYATARARNGARAVVTEGQTNAARLEWAAFGSGLLARRRSRAARSAGAGRRAAACGARRRGACPTRQDAPPAPALLVPPVPLELDAPPERSASWTTSSTSPVAGAVEDEEDEPPGTMIVSFSFVTVEVGGLPLGTGTTAVVSLRSQAERARGPRQNQQIAAMSHIHALFSSDIRCRCNSG